MYYHLLITTEDEENIFLLDENSLERIESEILTPHLQNNNYNVNGYTINRSEVKRILITETTVDSEECQGISFSAQAISDKTEIHPKDCVFDNDKFAKDITNELVNKLNAKLQASNNQDSTEILLKRIELEQIKARSEGAADTLSSIIIWAICVVLLSGVSYFTHWCIQNWENTVKDNAQSFAVVAGFDLTIVGVIFYLVKREWFSEMKIHSLFEKTMRGIYYNRNKFILKEYEEVCEKFKQLPQSVLMFEKNKEQEKNLALQANKIES